MRNILRAYYDEISIINVELDKLHYGGESSKFSLRDGENLLPLTTISKIDKGSYIAYTLTTNKLDLAKEYLILDEHLMSATLDIRYVVRSKEFDDEYYYDGIDLGSLYEKKQTKFAIWAPSASKVLLELEDLKGNIEFISMKREEKGVYRITVNGDLEGYKYRYGVKVGSEFNFALDPYAYSSNANHEKSFVVDLNKCKVERYDNNLPKLNSKLDSIIYELHVRDFSSSSYSNLKNKGKFVAFLEENVKTQNGYKSGIDYLASLGVTHIQLLPIYDFGSVDELNQFDSYNWGYDPMQYNVPEGSYALDPNDPYSRVRECKMMIEALHKKGLRVVMDVVYNHMFNRFNSAFEKIVPYYYFRLGSNGEVSNGSFCNNDFDSLKKMASKYIVDSTMRWLDFYNVDGFRFDLMGIIDIKTMNNVADEAKKRKENFLIYGEGWNMPTFMDDSLKACQFNNDKMKDVGFFSDRFRDIIKGSTSQDEMAKKGYLTGDSNYLNVVNDVLLASLLPLTDSYCYSSADQVINYVECHDNATLWDKLSVCCNDESEALRKKRAKLIIATTLLSQGIPFIHAGMEFLRTKNGDHNSYISSDEVNKFDYQLMEKNIDSVHFMQDVIALRKEFNCFKYNTRLEMINNISIKFVNNNVAVYKLKLEHPIYSSLHVIINPNKNVEYYSTHDTYRVLLTENGRLSQPLYVSNLIINPCSLVVIAKEKEKA